MLKHLLSRRSKAYKVAQDYFPLLLEELERDIQEHPNYADIHNRLGMARFFAGDLGAARAAFLRALTINKNYVDCVCNMAYAILETEGVASSLAWIRGHLERLSDWRVVHTYGRMLALAGLWYEAANVFESISYDRLLIRVDAAVCRLVADPADTRALAVLEKISAQSKPYAKILSKYGLLSTPLDRGKVTRFLRVNLNLHLVFVDMAKIAANRDNIRSARLLFIAAENIMPESPFAEHALGNILLAKNRRSYAKRHFLRAIQFDPSFVNAHLNLAYIFAAEGKNEEALKWFEEAVKAAPSYPDVRYQLANHLIQMGLYEQAIPHLKKALSVNPKYSLAQIALATAFFHLGRYAECLRAYRNLKPKTGEIAEVHAQKAACHLLLGDPVSAVKECALLLSGEDERATVLLYLAQALTKMGDYRRAKGILRLLRRAYPHTRAAAKSKILLRKKD